MRGPSPSSKRHDDDDEDEDSGRPSPESGDAWADEALKYARDDVGGTLLKLTKYYFGTEFQSKTPAEKEAILRADEDSPWANVARSGDNSKGGGKLVFQEGNLILYDHQGKVIVKLSAESGHPGVSDPSIAWMGPIPPGNYTLIPSEISKGGILRNLLEQGSGLLLTHLKPNDIDRRCEVSRRQP